MSKIVQGSKVLYLCSKCGKYLPAESFYVSERYTKCRDRLSSWCRSCVVEYSIEYNRKHRKKWQRKLKLAALDRYGTECANCGESRFELLCIDHANHDGRKHRREIGVNPGVQFYMWLKRNNYPDDLGLRTLCVACNTKLFQKGRKKKRKKIAAKK